MRRQRCGAVAAVPQYPIDRTAFSTGMLETCANILESYDERPQYDRNPYRPLLIAPSARAITLRGMQSAQAAGGRTECARLLGSLLGPLIGRTWWAVPTAMIGRPLTPMNGPCFFRWSRCRCGTRAHFKCRCRKRDAQSWASRGRGSSAPIQSGKVGSQPKWCRCGSGMPSSCGRGSSVPVHMWR